MYQRGVILQLYGDIDDRRHEWAQLLGLDDVNHVELWIERIPTRHQGRYLRSMLSGRSVNIHAPFIQLSLSTDIKELGDYSVNLLDRTLQLASELDARVVTCHAGPYPFFLPKETALHNLVTRLESLTNASQPILTVENMPTRSGTLAEPICTSKDVDALAKLLPSVRLTFDVGHCIQNGEDFEKFMKHHRKRIENVHLHDAWPGGRAHLSLGSGSLDLDRFLDSVVQTGFSREIVLETISVRDTKRSWQHWTQAEIERSSRWHASPRRREG